MHGINICIKDKDFFFKNFICITIKFMHAAIFSFPTDDHVQ